MKIKSLPESERPREKLLRFGAGNLSDAELLAILLRTGNKDENVVAVAAKILAKRSLKSLSRTRVSTLKKEHGIGQAKACEIAACMELGRRLAASKHSNFSPITSAKDVAKRFLPEMSSLTKEQCKAIFLNTKNNILREETLFVGSLNESIIHPREVFQSALAENAAAVILVHNHPSGDPQPSDEDIAVTKRIAEAGGMLGIPLLDHVIIGAHKYASLREQGIIP